MGSLMDRELGERMGRPTDSLCRWTKKEGTRLLGRMESGGQSKKQGRGFSEGAVPGDKMWL